MLKYFACGAARTVTGSMHYFEYSTQNNQKFRFCVDAGMFQVGHLLNLYRINSHLNFDPKKLDCVVLTHAHLDHCGRLPYLVKMGFGGRIYANLATKKITEIVLQDAVLHQGESSSYPEYFFEDKIFENKIFEESMPSSASSPASKSTNPTSPAKDWQANLQEYTKSLPKQDLTKEDKIIPHLYQKEKAYRQQKVTNANKKYQNLLKKHEFLARLPQTDQSLANAYFKYGSELKLYDKQNVEDTLTRFEIYEYHHKFDIHPNLQVEFFDAGHILGSCYLVLTEKSTGKQIVFSGDIGNKDKPIIEDPEAPKNLKKVGHIFIETTYGNRNHPKLKPKLRLRKIAYKALSKGGKLLIPSFSIERAQEVIYFLTELMRENKLPKVPIYLDSPMASKMLAVCLEHPELYDENMQDKIKNQANPLIYKYLKILETVEESKTLNEKKDPCIIIAGSGMLTGGRILKHLKFNIENPKNTLLIVGYQAEGTLGRKILDKHPQVYFEGQDYQVKCCVEVINEFSAHADKLALKEWILDIVTKSKNTDNKTKVMLVHGEREAMEVFQKELQVTMSNKVDCCMPYYSQQIQIW
jgi:metallo-beta-lactamase family protein